MQSTSCEMLGWMNHKLESRLPGETSITTYANCTTMQMAESEEEITSLLMKVKEENEKAGLKLNIQKTKIMALGPITSWQIDGETMETVTDFIFLGSKITADGECSHEIQRCLLLGRKAMTNIDSILKSRHITLPTKVHLVSSVQFSSVAQSCPTLCHPMDCSTPGLSVHHQLPEFTQTHVHRVGDAIQPSHPLSFPSPPTFNLSQHWGKHQGLFSNESVLRIRWPKYWSFSFCISPSNEHSGLISCRIDRLDLLAVQGTLKSLLQHHSSKASIIRRSAFFTEELSHPYMTTGKTIALTRGTSVGKVISLLLNMLSRLVITSLPRSKRVLISWLQSPSVVILEPRKIKSATVSMVSPFICHEVMGPDAMILVLNVEL